MMAHLGGPEPAAKIADRNRRYAEPRSRQYRIVLRATGEAVGWVGYWERDWRDDQVFETGWSVLPAFQGRGIATAAIRSLIRLAQAERTRRYLLAYPAVENDASNAVCRKAGFTMVGDSDYEYPPGNLMHCNEWRMDLYE